MSWNLGNFSTFAIDENSIHQAGYIHTSQGLEFYYVGVTIGEDLRFENEKSLLILQRGNIRIAPYC